MDFLNTTLAPFHEHITSVTPADPEKLQRTEADRKFIYDLECKTQEGSRILIEMQNARSKNLIDRSLYYQSQMILAQSDKGENWDYHLDKVYMIVIIDDELNELKAYPNQYKSTVVFRVLENGMVWSWKVVSIYLELKKFKKQYKLWRKNQDRPLDLVEERLEKWLYYISRSPEFEFEPETVEDPLFQKVLQVAEVANMTTQEQVMYSASMKAKRDKNWVINSAKKEYFAKGEARERAKAQKEKQEIRAKAQKEKQEIRAKAHQEKLEIAKNLLAQGIDPKMVSQATGLSLEELAKL